MPAISVAKSEISAYRPEKYSPLSRVQNQKPWRQGGDREHQKEDTGSNLRRDVWSDGSAGSRGAGRRRCRHAGASGPCSRARSVSCQRSCHFKRTSRLRCHPGIRARSVPLTFLRQTTRPRVRQRKHGGRRRGSRQGERHYRCGTSEVSHTVAPNRGPARVTPGRAPRFHCDLRAVVADLRGWRKPGDVHRDPFREP